MPLNLKQLINRAKEYVELEGDTKVKRVTFAERFHLLGREDIARRNMRDILYCFCQEKKVRKNKIFKNNELKIDPLFRKTSPSDSVHRVVFDFDESLALKKIKGDIGSNTT